MNASSSVGSPSNDAAGLVELADHHARARASASPDVERHAAEQRAEQRGLARAVGPDDGHALGPADLERRPARAGSRRARPPRRSSARHPSPLRAARGDREAAAASPPTACRPPRAARWRARCGWPAPASCSVVSCLALRPILSLSGCLRLAAATPWVIHSRSRWARALERSRAWSVYSAYASSAWLAGQWRARRW